MRISPRTVDDLLTMVDHSRRDMSYFGGGSFIDIAKTEKSDDNVFDQKDARKVERAIEFIKKIILERDANDRN